MTRLRKLLIVVLVSLPLLLGLGYFVLLGVLPYAIVTAPNAGALLDRAADPQASALAAAGVAQHLLVDVGPPPATISCYVLDPPRRRPVATVVLLHGIHDRKDSLLGAGRRLAATGYRAVLLDHRGHGRSTGKFLTYGVVESRDVSQVIEALAARGLLVPPVGALGFSYGAAVAIQAAARQPAITAVVSVAAFSSLRKVLAPYVRNKVPLLGAFISQAQLEHATIHAAQLGGFTPEEADSAAAARRTRAQILVLHGLEDSKIPASHAVEIARAAGRHGRLVLLEGEGHDSMMADRSGRMWREITAWFQRNLQPTR